MGRVIPASVCRSSGSSVRLPAKLTPASVMVCPFLVPGRAVCPALGPGGRWNRGMPQDHQEQATEPTKSARLDQVADRGRLGCRVGWSTRLRLGGGEASTVPPDPPPPGAGGGRGAHHHG